MNAVLDELIWRGLLVNSTDKAALSDHLDAGPVIFYVGFDPTAASLHMGHLVQLLVARTLQRAGHRPLLLVGGSTGLIGDPKAAGERVMNPKGTVAEWVGKIQHQVAGFLDFDGPNPARIVNNLDWTGDLTVLDFLRDIGKHFPVNRMLAREVVKARLEQGISYTEFSYVLLQSYDYLRLFRDNDCTLQFGGSDQWGNIAAGAELIRRSAGAQVHGLATPLLTKADGTKFGKTETGTVWLNPELTSPYALYQFFLNAEDGKVIDYVKVFCERSREEIQELERLTVEQPERRAAQRVLADDVTALVHSPADRDAAVAAADALFGRSDLSALPIIVMASVAAELNAARLDGGDALPTVVEVLEHSGVVASAIGGAARDRRRRGVPEQSTHHRPGCTSSSGRPAPRPLCHPSPGQTHGRRRHDRTAMTAEPQRPSTSRDHLQSPSNPRRVMPFATGFVPTSRAQRYIKQLVSHFGNKVSTELTDSGGLIEFDFGRCALETTADGIRLVASADSAEQVTTVQDVIARHLERFGAADDLHVTWRAD